MFYVISYDITDNKRRQKIHDTLLGHGEWIQYSVFECQLRPGQLRSLRASVDPTLAPGSDSIRYYRLCKDCLRQTIAVGGRPITNDPDFWIV